MSIDLFCYSSETTESILGKLESIKSRYAEVIGKKFVFSEPRIANDVHREIAGEFNFDARSLFLIGLNDKASADQISVMSDILKTDLGKSNVLILLNNETLR